MKNESRIGRPRQNATQDVMSVRGVPPHLVSILKAIVRSSGGTPGQVISRLIADEGERIGIGSTVESLQAWQDARLASIDARIEARRAGRRIG